MFRTVAATIAEDTDSFVFEDLTVHETAFDAKAHAHDHAAYVLEGTGVVHVPDVINPDQPPFWSFAGALGCRRQRPGAPTRNDP